MWTPSNVPSLILPISSMPMKFCCSSVPPSSWYRTVNASSTVICIASRKFRISSNNSNCRVRNWAPSSNRWKCETANSLPSSICSPAIHTLWSSCLIRIYRQKLHLSIFEMLVNISKSWRIRIVLRRRHRSCLIKHHVDIEWVFYWNWFTKLIACKCFRVYVQMSLSLMNWCCGYDFMMMLMEKNEV